MLNQENPQIIGPVSDKKTDFIFLSIRVPRGTIGIHGETQSGLGSPRVFADMCVCLCVCAVPGRAPRILRGSVNPQRQEPLL